MLVAFAHIFFSKTFQHICVSLNVTFNESLTNDVVRFEQLGPDSLKVNQVIYSSVHIRAPSLKAVA